MLSPCEMMHECYQHEYVFDTYHNRMRQFLQLLVKYLNFLSNSTWTIPQLFTDLKKTSNPGSVPTSFVVECCYCWCCFPSVAECCLDSQPRPPGEAAHGPTSRPPPTPPLQPHNWVRADGGYAAAAAGAVEDEMGCCRWPAARDGLPRGGRHVRIWRQKGPRFMIVTGNPGWKFPDAVWWAAAAAAAAPGTEWG